jgi:hypothetical protein
MYLYASFLQVDVSIGGAVTFAAKVQGACTQIAGSVPPTIDVAARKPRYYGHFSEPVLWRDVMCEKASGKPRVFRSARARGLVMGDHAGFRQLRPSIRRPRYVVESPVPQRPPQASLCCHRSAVPGLASKLRPDGRTRLSGHSSSSSWTTGSCRRCQSQWLLNGRLTQPKQSGNTPITRHP